MVMPASPGQTYCVGPGVRMPVILTSAHDVIVGAEFFAVRAKPFSLRTMTDVVATAVEHARSRNA